MTDKERGQLNRIFPVVLFVIFALLTVFQTLMCAGLYKSLREKDGQFFEETVFSDYIRTKVLSVCEYGSVTAGRCGDGDALFLSEENGGIEYETVIYFYGGYLREQFKRASDETDPNAGAPIFDAGSFSVSQINDNCLKCSAELCGGVQNVYINIPCGIAKEKK